MSTKLRLLQKALREPMLEGFHWDMGCPMCCAIGLARHLGIVRGPYFMNADKLSLSEAEYLWLFMPHQREIGGLFYTEVTPDIQADRIDQLLARRTPPAKTS